MPVDLDSLHSRWIAAPTTENADSLFRGIHACAMRRFGGDEDAAQNLVADLVSSLGSYRGSGLFSNWLSAVMRRHRADQLRKAIVERLLEPLPGDENDDGECAPLSRLPLRQMDPQTRRAVDAVLCGSSFREAAAEAGLSEAAFGMRLRRLGQKLSRRG